jgi:arsenate reductase
MKNVLILCTGNSCRSIMAEALINAKMGDRYRAYSSGVRASGRVNPNAQKILTEKGIWRDEYHSKTLDTMMDKEYDLIVTVCDHAHETCPMFPRPVPKIHVGFEDPDGKGYEAFEETYRELESSLLPAIDGFFNPVEKAISATAEGVKINFTGGIAKNTVFTMVQNCQNGQCDCMSDETKAKIASMEVGGEDGNVELTLGGQITKEEVEAALAKSKVLPGCGC